MPIRPATHRASGQARRAALLEAAVEVIAEQGVAGEALREALLARAVGVRTAADGGDRERRFVVSLDYRPVDFTLIDDPTLPGDGVEFGQGGPPGREDGDDPRGRVAGQPFEVPGERQEVRRVRVALARDHDHQEQVVGDGERELAELKRRREVGHHRRPARAA